MEEVSEPASSCSSSFCTSNTSGLTKDASAKEIGILSRGFGETWVQDDGMDAKVKLKICLQAKCSLLLVSWVGEIWNIQYSCFVGNTKVSLVKTKAINRQHSLGNHSQQNSGTTDQPTNQTPQPTNQPNNAKLPNTTDFWWARHRLPIGSAFGACGAGACSA